MVCELESVVALTGLLPPSVCVMDALPHSWMHGWSTQVVQLSLEFVNSSLENAPTFLWLKPHLEHLLFNVRPPTTHHPPPTPTLGRMPSTD